MTSNDAQARLTEIRRLQERTSDEYVRHGFSRPYLITAALMIFIALASFDLPNPWSGAMLLPVFALVVGQLITYRRRASVRRRPTGPEVLFALGLSAVFLAAFAGLLAAARAMGAPAPHAVAAAVLALASLPVAGLARRAFGALVRWESRPR
ncbi:hypothetical protein [Streptomyces sp. NPDC102437]|uniref:hypothetical protein n=1 Tax=Streptomyces sp. NPDC102437 TaxID=3366175 RepID=UPI003830DAC2